MAHPKETKAAVRADYIGGMPLDLAAVKNNVPAVTARRWKADAADKGDDWDKFQRASLLVSGGGFDAAMGRAAAAFVLRVEATLEVLSGAEDANPMDVAKAMASLADSLMKAKAVAKALMPETDQLAIENAAVKAYVELLVKRNPSAAEAALDALDLYSNGDR